MRDTQKIKVGDRVYVDGEGNGTVVEITFYAIGVRVDSDGIEVDCAFSQVSLLEK